MIKQPKSLMAQGFTLVELLMVTAIIGLLAMTAAPFYTGYMEKANLVETALNLGHWSREFKRWEIMNGRFPNDSHIVLPPEAASRLAINNDQWLATTPLGGNWNWEGPNGYPYAGIAIYEATASVSELEQLDFLLDNGDLATGSFRQTPNGRYTYIIDE